MTTGTQWHAIRPLVALSTIAGVRAIKKKKLEKRTRAIGCHCKPSTLPGTRAPNVHDRRS
jgi:hypothetical protein